MLSGFLPKMLKVCPINSEFIEPTLTPMTHQGPIGIFDSGYGGLTILRDLRNRLPQYDFVYLGDNARAPYGTRSFDVVYQFTLQAVRTLFSMGCNLVILACNTASAKALRTIQQRDLPQIDETRRVLGVIRPTVEKIGQLTTTGHIGILGTPGTVQSLSYNMEIAKMYPDFSTTGHGCTLWASLVEAGEADSDGADFFVAKDIKALFATDPDIDTVILGCTHYPLLLHKIMDHIPAGVKVVNQGPIIAESLDDYLHRHPEMAQRCSTTGSCAYFTTELPEKFDSMTSLFLGEQVHSRRIELLQS